MQVKISIGVILVTIFGAVFESTLNPETRRSGGMHYTSIENIHKVIDPLFLDELKKELNEILLIKVLKTKKKKFLKKSFKMVEVTGIECEQILIFKYFIMLQSVVKSIIFRIFLC